MLGEKRRGIAWEKISGDGKSARIYVPWSGRRDSNPRQPAWKACGSKWCGSLTNLGVIFGKSGREAASVSYAVMVSS